MGAALWVPASVLTIFAIKYAGLSISQGIWYAFFPSPPPTPSFTSNMPAADHLRPQVWIIEYAPGASCSCEALTKAPHFVVAVIVSFLWGAIFYPMIDPHKHDKGALWQRMPLAWLGLMLDCSPQPCFHTNRQEQHGRGQVIPAVGCRVGRPMRGYPGSLAERHPDHRRPAVQVSLHQFPLCPLPQARQYDRSSPQASLGFPLTGVTCSVLRKRTPWDQQRWPLRSS